MSRSNPTPLETNRKATRAAAFAFGAGLCLCASPRAVAQDFSPSHPTDDALRVYAVHVDRTPRQSWPGYGVYLGNGLVLTAAHVAGNVVETRPRAIIGGVGRPTALVKQGSFNGVDLTLLSVDATTLPVRMRMRRLPLCADAPYPGQTVVVVTPEGAARSHVLPPSAVPPSLRARYDTVIGDVATTGNSGSGVLDAAKTCLLGVVSSKISVRRPGGSLGAPRQTRDIAKYFVPVKDIRAFLPAGIAF